MKISKSRPQPQPQPQPSRNRNENRNRIADPGSSKEFFSILPSYFLVARNFVRLQDSSAVASFLGVSDRDLGLWFRYQVFINIFKGEWRPSSDSHGSGSFVFCSRLPFQRVTPRLIDRRELRTILLLRYRKLTSFGFLRFDTSQLRLIYGKVLLTLSYLSFTSWSLRGKEHLICWVKVIQLLN